MNRFTFASNTINGKGYIDTSATIPDSAKVSMHHSIDVYFQVNVKTFDSGNSRMNRDMFKALKAEQYPNIEFKLDSLQLEESLTSSEAKVLVQSTVRVAGVENTISFPVTMTHVSNELFHLQGSEEVRMTDHDVEPPTALFGLVQARDNLTVEFDIYASKSVGSTVALHQTRKDKE